MSEEEIIHTALPSNLVVLDIGEDEENSDYVILVLGQVYYDATEKMNVQVPLLTVKLNFKKMFGYVWSSEVHNKLKKYFVLPKDQEVVQ